MAPKTKKSKTSQKEEESGKDQSTTKKHSVGSASSPSAKKLKPATSINVRHILNAKQSVSEVAKAELETGASFSEVATKFSEDKARQGGSLGWKVRGSLLADFEKAAYELEPSSVSKAIYTTIKTSEGYHIIMVEGRK